MEIVPCNEWMRFGRVEGRRWRESWEWWQVIGNVPHGSDLVHENGMEAAQSCKRWQWPLPKYVIKPKGKTKAKAEACIFPPSLAADILRWRRIGVVEWVLSPAVVPSVIWIDNFIFLNLPSLSVKKDNNACPNSPVSCLAVYKCSLLWEMVSVAQRKLCRLSTAEKKKKKQPLCQWKCCIPFSHLPKSPLFPWPTPC